MTHYTASSKPWIIVTRDPDSDTDVEVVNGHVGVVVLDYGSSFDGMPTDAETLRDWVENARDQIKNAPEEVRDIVEGKVQALLVDFAMDIQGERSLAEAREILGPLFHPETAEVCGYPDEGKPRPQAPDGSGDLWWDDASYITYQAMP